MCYIGGVPRLYRIVNALIQFSYEFLELEFERHMMSFFSLNYLTITYYKGHFNMGFHDHEKILVWHCPLEKYERISRALIYEVTSRAMQSYHVITGNRCGSLWKQFHPRAWWSYVLRIKYHFLPISAESWASHWTIERFPQSDI